MQDALRGHGFEPCQDEDGTIRLRNCPFHHLAAQHRDIVCGMNLALIEGLVAGLRASGLQPVLRSPAGHCCVAIGAPRSRRSRRRGRRTEELLMTQELAPEPAEVTPPGARSRAGHRAAIPAGSADSRPGAAVDLAAAERAAADFLAALGIDR